MTKELSIVVRAKDDCIFCNYDHLDEPANLEDMENGICNCKKKKTGIQDIDYLAMEAIYEKLCVRQLFQLRVVSPEWNDSIRDTLSRRCKSTVFLCDTGNKGMVAVIQYYRGSEDAFTVHEFEIPALETFTNPFRILGACAEFVCLGDGKRKHILLNMSTKLFFEFYEEEGNFGVYSFGVDRASKEQKLVKVVCHKTDGTLVYTYTLASRSWKKIIFPDLFMTLDYGQGWGSGCIDGSSYWLDTSTDSMVFFDLSVETFEFVELPEQLCHDNTKKFGVVKESSCDESTEVVLGCVTESINKTSYTHIWKLYQRNAFEKLEFEFPAKEVCPLAFHKDERLLVVLEERTYIKVYALKEIPEESIEVNRLYVTKCPKTLDAVWFEDGESEFTCACGRRPKPKKPCKFKEFLLEEGWQPWGKTNFETEEHHNTSMTTYDKMTRYGLLLDFWKDWEKGKGLKDDAQSTKILKQTDSGIERSVARIVTVIDLAHSIRELHSIPIETPLRELTVVHHDAKFVKDVPEKIREFVLKELNVHSLVTTDDELKYAALRAEPNFSLLGKRFGMHLEDIAKEVEEMSQESILAFEKSGEVTISDHCFKLSDIKVVRDFKCPDGTTENDIDAIGNGDVLVVLDLRPEESFDVDS